MQEYYEELWERLGDELKLPEFERRRQFLLREIKPGERALDLGCGNGDFTAEMAYAGAVPIGIDVARAALRRARARHPQLQFKWVAIGAALPLQDHSVDLVWAGEVIEHVADTASWLSEVRRVLPPGGRLVLTTPSHGRLRLALGGIERFSEPLGDHLHLYSGSSLRSLLEEFGFVEVSVKAVAGPPLLRRTLLARAVRG